jgi:hypothetical protein
MVYILEVSTSAKPFNPFSFQPIYHRGGGVPY